MINPHNLEGVGMGESPYAGDLLHLSLKFLSEYTDNKADEIEAMIVDPHYSLSHHVILKETGDDTRIFATEIPEVNLDDDPDNDVAYDSFEVKINYPLPYPQIIEKGQIRNSIDGLTHRSLADSCEIEYVKKNGEIINDLDDDGEIQEKERLNFPVWQGPDYEDEERWVRLNSAGVKEGSAQTRNYYISNMIFTKEQCNSLDQTQFINKDSKFFVKVLNDEIRNVDLKIQSYRIDENGNEEIIDTKQLDFSELNPGEYLSQSFYTFKNDNTRNQNNLNSDDSIFAYGDFKDSFLSIFGIINNKYFKTKGKILDDCFIIQFLNPENILEQLNMPFHWLKTMNIYEIIKSKLRLSLNIDKSPTLKEISGYLSDNIPLFYVEAHGTTSWNTEKNRPEPSIMIGKNSIDDNDREYIKDGYITIDYLKSVKNRKIKLSILNSCYSAYDFKDITIPGTNGTNQELMNALNTEFFIGWQKEAKVDVSVSFVKAFLNCLKVDDITILNKEEFDRAAKEAIKIVSNLGYSVQEIENHFKENLVYKWNMEYSDD